MAFKFEGLRVWQKSIELSGEISEIIYQFHKKELFVLTAQIQSAADSIALNIADGSTGQTNAKFKKFLGYALRSAIEVVSCLHLARRRKLIHQEQFERFYLS